MRKTILVVDDHATLRSTLSAFLAGEGYRVVMAENGQMALEVARHEQPDLILLDVIMPEMDGYAFMRVWQAESTTPVILLSVKGEETDKVVGLELGADDYVTKPFSPRELLARVRAVLRRSERAAATPQLLRAADVTLDRSCREVSVAGRTVKLTPLECELLAALLAAPGRVFSRLELIGILQRVESKGTERTISLHIHNLRTKIESDPARPRYVETVFGGGYRFRAETGGE